MFTYLQSVELGDLRDIEVVSREVELIWLSRHLEVDCRVRDLSGQVAIMTYGVMEALEGRCDDGLFATHF